jgi:hypothetical protein
MAGPAITNPWIQSKNLRDTLVDASSSAYQPSPLLRRLRTCFQRTCNFVFMLLSPEPPAR